MYFKSAAFYLIIYAFLSGCSKKVAQQFVSKPVGPKREFRAVWVATIDNIDWPSRKGLSADIQQQEFRTLLDRQKSYGMNAVLVQVRAASDAFYARSKEPWSEWLTGEQGKAPTPFYDPMTFMIHEAHQRGMEFHAWLNMNRGTHKASKSITPDHLTLTKPEWFLSYGGYKLFNLGIPEVRTYITDVVVNIVRYYDIDGIHFDDYFYPYTIANEKLRDEDTFRKYKGNFTNIEDWRRNNVDLIVKDISDAIRREKPKVKFGVSPVGVWRNASVDPSGSQTAGGQTSYDNLYADTKKWIQKGWIDYIAPQIYFSFEFNKVPYKTLADWWTNHTYERHLYIGHAAYRVKAGSNEIGWERPNQIPRQVRYNRSKTQISGSIYFSAKPLTKNELSVTDSLRNLYFYPALPPTMPWKDNIPPNAPENLKVKKVSDGGIFISWDLPSSPPKDGDEVNAFVVYRFDENEKINLENPARIIGIVRNEGMLNYTDKTYDSGRSYVYVVTALDRLSNESTMSNTVKIKL
ncbi:glycoside hydrolase family 10 protein [Emticicia sp. 17c]|uniref:glycoside hydrolase family 10 protein n=1 Tax=Emticicia sp. 17c TaxID=3127704 RepID=UPI00301C5AB4